MAGVCTGPGPCVTTPLGAGKNWVTSVGGLPLYIRAIAQALMRSGRTETNAIQIAVSRVKLWAAGGGNVSAATRARAAKAVAEWEAKKAAAHALSTTSQKPIDLGHPHPGQQYRHGWIRLVPTTEGGQRIYTVGGKPHVEKTITVEGLQPGDRIGAGSSTIRSAPVAHVTPKADGTVQVQLHGKPYPTVFSKGKRMKVLRPHRGKVRA